MHFQTKNQLYWCISKPKFLRLRCISRAKIQKMMHFKVQFVLYSTEPIYVLLTSTMGWCHTFFVLLNPVLFTSTLFFFCRRWHREFCLFSFGLTEYIMFMADVMHIKVLSFLAGSHHHSLFTLQRYVKSWQIPNTTLLSAKILFQQTSAIRDWVF